MILYIGNPEEKLLNLINSSRLPDTRTRQKVFLFLYISNAHLYTSNGQSEVKETIPFTIVTKWVKYLVISLTKEVADLHSKKCKTMSKEIKDLNKWKKSYVPRSEYLILLRCQHSPNWCTYSMQSLPKFLFGRNWLTLKFIWNCKGAQTARAIMFWRQLNKAGVPYPDFKSYYKPQWSKCSTRLPWWCGGFKPLPAHAEDMGTIPVWKNSIRSEQLRSLCAATTEACTP